MRLRAYTQLFEDLATRHVDIRYTPENGRFMRILVSSDPIAQQLDLSDFHNSLKSKLKAAPVTPGRKFDGSNGCNGLASKSVLTLATAMKSSGFS